MHPVWRRALATAGMSIIAFSSWQWSVGTRESAIVPLAEDGQISWALPAQVRPLGRGGTFTAPRTRITFDTTVTYPATLYTGQAFQIVLESAISAVDGSDGSRATPEQDERIRAWLGEAHHAFALELPGLEFAPAGANTFSVDDRVRWQVAPVREAGVFRGYIRPRAGTADLLGAEYAIQWAKPGDFELEIEVRKSLRFLDKLETLAMGLVGSVLSFPALMAIYNSLRARRHGR
jgi:hypothetical protein